MILMLRDLSVLAVGFRIVLFLPSGVLLRFLTHYNLIVYQLIINDSSHWKIDWRILIKVDIGNRQPSLL